MPLEIQHSEEVQQILGKAPSWMIRWGVTVIFIIFIGILIGCYFIKYPQTVNAPIVITTDTPPIELLARTSGRIEHLFIQEERTVGPEDPIALLYSTASYTDIQTVKDSLNAYKIRPGEQLAKADWVNREYILGDVQATYIEFRRVCLDYRHYLLQDYTEKKRQLLSEQISKNREYYRKQQNQRKTLQLEIDFEQKNTERDSTLYLNNVISLSDYEQSIRGLLQKKLSMDIYEASLTNIELSILQMEQQLVELSIQQENETVVFERSLSHARQQLGVQLANWEYQYLIRSPIAGIISFSSFWSNNQSIQNGERIATVIPAQSERMIGRLVIPSQGFGNVQVGQTVNVKLNGFPFMEYGLLKGRIASLSEVPEQDDFISGYIAEVHFPDGLKTTYNKELVLIHQMDGIGEIITRDQRLIERFLQPIRAFLEN